MDGTNVRSLLEPKDPQDTRRSEYTASLRVYSEAVRHAEMTRLLGPPTTGYEVGEPVSTRKPQGAKRAQAAWLLSSSADRSASLELHLGELVSFAEERSTAIDQLRSECRIDIFCGVFRGDLEAPVRLDRFVLVLACGFTLDPELMRRLADLQLSVGFDIY